MKITAPFDGTHTAQTKQYYDANGNLITRKTLTNDIGGAERWDTVSFAYDNRNRNTTATAYPTADAPEITQQFYDDGGLLTARVSGLSAAIASPANAPNGALRYTYDQMGNVLTETDEEGRVESYTYDNFGNLLTKTDRNGTVLSYTYNADGKVLSITTQSAADEIEPVTVNFTYNVLGAPVTAAANGQSTRYTYDGFGRVTAETTGDVVKNYSYDNNGNVTGVRITKNGTQIYNMTYTYDALGQLSKATAPNMTRTYAYNANGALASESDGTGTANYTYNAGGLLTGISGPAITESYTYARNGMKIQESSTIGGQKSYEYDGAGRLVSETFGTTGKTYAYDKRGNRVSGVELIEGAAKSTTYAYDNSNRLTQAVTVHGQVEEEICYYYDNAGNLYSTMTGRFAPATSEKANVSLSGMADDVSLYGWNALGQQVSYTGNGHTASYTYGADGIRTSKTVDGQTTQLVNVSGSVVAELGSQTTAYYRANGKVLYAKTGTTIANYTYNGHGDVIKAGTQTYTYDAFGNQRNPSDNDTNPFRYCGEYWDGESGQIYLRARYYAPSIGRFTASDPARDGANWYVYAGNNPVMFFDPWGLAITPEDRAAYESGRMPKSAWNLLNEADTMWNNAREDDYTTKAEAHAKAVVARSWYKDMSNDNFDYTFGLGASALDDGDSAGMYMKTATGQMSNGQGTALIMIVYERYFSYGKPYIRLIRGSGYSGGNAAIGLFASHIEGNYTSSVFGGSEFESPNSAFSVDINANLPDTRGDSYYGVSASFYFNDNGKEIFINISNNIYSSYYINEKKEIVEEITPGSDFWSGRGGGGR